MSRKRRVDLVKSDLQKLQRKIIDVQASIIESPTTGKSLENKGLISSPKNDEAEVAVAAMHDLRDAINASKSRRSDDSKAAYGLKKKVSKMLNIKRKRVSSAFNYRTKLLKSKKYCWTYTKR